MSRFGFLLSGMCILVLTVGPRLAAAQPMPEASPQACHDGIDNDGNGYVDCNDPSCAPYCQGGGGQYVPPPPGYQQPPPGYQQPPPGYQQPPPGYQPPPPGYQQPPPGYQQPPPGYYVQPQPVYVMPTPMMPRPPRNGIAAIVTGFILLPLGLIFIAAGAWLITDACRPGGGCGNAFAGRSSDYDNYWSGVALEILGVPFTIAGLILVPIGFIQYARYSRWKRDHGMAFLHHKNVTLEPVFGAAKSMFAASPLAGIGQSGTLGLKLTW